MCIHGVIQPFAGYGATALSPPDKSAAGPLDATGGAAA